MEKTCEFCGAPRPIVFCQADGAFLCLSCDGKVHSANALSSRHSRTLLCDSCRYNQAYVRCLDHLMLLCRRCDSRLHKHTPQHKKLTINSFSGCPSAKHFAALWGFNANELVEFSARGQLGSESCLTSNYQKEQKNCLIMQQILDLKKLQLIEEDGRAPFPRHCDESVTPMHSSSGILNEGLDQQLKELDCVGDAPQSMDTAKGERYTTAMSQLDDLPGSFAVADSFWHCKNPADNSKLWSQNMQDIGVCEEQGSFDDFNMPEVDATFHNFEDLFTGDAGLTQALLEDDDVMWSEIEKATRQDLSVALSIRTNKEANPSDHFANQLSRSFQNSHHLFKSSCTASFSPSRLSVESSGSECLDSGHSGSFPRDGLWNIMPEGHCMNAEGTECPVKSSKERKKTRMHGKQTQLSPRKVKGDLHKRTKSRCFQLEGYESDGVNVTKRSFDCNM